MCDKCEELDKKIVHYRKMILAVSDQPTVERIKVLVEDLRAQKLTLHPDQKQ
jgi:tetrahydromethanopterin S-methyltransferase subunit F